MPWFRIYTKTVCIRACLSCNCNIQVFPSILRLLTYIHSPHKNLSRKERRTPICLTCQVAKMLEGHTIRRILPPIIDDVDKYQFAILGSSLRSLGLPVSLGSTGKKLAKRKGKKMSKKGVDARFFFFSALLFSSSSQKLSCFLWTQFVKIFLSVHRGD